MRRERPVERGSAERAGTRHCGRQIIRSQHGGLLSVTEAGTHAKASGLEGRMGLP